MTLKNPVLALIILFCAFLANQGVTPVFGSSQEKFDQGQSFMKEGKNSDAIRAFSEAINEDPTNWQAFSKRAYAHSFLAQHREAIQDYSQAIKLHPGDVNLYFLRAYAYSRVREGKLGLADADEALKLGCREPSLYLARALALQTVGRFDEALQDAITYEKMTPNTDAALQALSQIYWDMGKYRECLTQLDKLLELNPLDPSPYLDRGQAYASLNDLESARENYRTYLRLMPSPSNALGLAGRVRAENELGQHKEALEEARKALSLNPEEFTRNTLQFYVGWALVGLGQYTEGIRELDRYLQQRPDYSLAFRLRSIAYTMLGNYVKATEDARAAVFNNKRSFDARLQLAVVLKAAGQFQEALVAVGPALAMRPSSVDALKVRQACYTALHRDGDAQADREDIERLSQHNGQSTSSVSIANAGPANSVASSLLLKTDKIAAQKNNAAGPTKRQLKDKWALIIGISKFKDEKLNLRFPAKDAQDFYNYLIKDGHFAPDHVKLLTDAQATRVNILSACGDKWLPRVANPDDLVVIYISSHGSPAESDLGGVSYVVAHDTSADELYATGIPLQDLTRIIKKRVHCDRVVIILDACHSGAADPSAKGLLRSSNVNAEDLSIGTGQLVISSSQPSQQSWEFKNKPNSVFTRHLIDGLKSKGERTPLKDAFSYLQEKVQADVLAERGQLQVPMLKSQWEGDDLVIGIPPASPRNAPISGAQ